MEDPYELTWGDFQDTLWSEIKYKIICSILSSM
jgi:hypothetical protein